MQFVLGGCMQRETTQTVKSPVLERRTQADASEPLLRSEWQVEDGRIVGHVVWGSCVSERAWSVEEQKIEHVRPLPAAGWLTAGAGSAAIITGLAIRNTQLTVKCTDVPQSGEEPSFPVCQGQEPENGASNAAIVVGTLALVTGAVLIAIRPSDKVTVLKHEPHAERSVSPCIAPEDLAVMSLLLKLGKNRFVHVTVAANGEASADLAASAHLPKGADLDIVVYRAPPVFAKALPRWTVIGHVHVPD
ncbi:MAG: hypothetical protein WDO69_06615 [Pseudomonadota bacterium]